MAASQVSICNLALSWLAGNLIISIDDDITEAKLCKANYEPSLDAVLETMAWTFATKRYTLTPETETPSWGYQKQFTIPADVLTVLEATAEPNVANGANKLDWRREGSRILCDEDKIYIKAIFRETDPVRFTPNFTQTFAARIAMDICIPLTESLQLMTAMQQKYGTLLGIAATTDGLQGKSDVFVSDALIRARV